MDKEKTKNIIRILMDNRDNLNETEVKKLEEMEENEFVIPLLYKDEHIGWTNVNSVTKHGGVKIEFINEEVKKRIVKFCYPTPESIAFISLSNTLT